MISWGLVLAAALGTVADVQSILSGTLEGAGVSVAEAQRALSETLGWSVSTRSGVVAAGRAVRIQELDPALVYKELGDDTEVLQYFEVIGQGPAPIRIHVPANVETPISVHRRIEPELYLRLDSVVREKNHVRIDVSWPGEFLVCPERKPTESEGKALLPESPPPSSDPALKAKWRFYRAVPEAATGPTPLILIHGATTDRWVDFIDWAGSSSEAETLRSHFQIWNFSHNTEGIDVPVGYDRSSPAFPESIVSYLHRFIVEATTVGFETGGVRYRMPDGAFAMLTHSHGALKARAFLVNFPEYAERCLGVITLGGTHMGALLGTPEWIRYSASRFGLMTPNVVELIIEEAFAMEYISTRRQSELDMGWGNFDALGGFGFPTVRFQTWTYAEGRSCRVLSPRDANQTGARELPGFEIDTTFEPSEFRDTYCGALDLITPKFRGDMNTDKFILYGSYIEPGRGLLDIIQGADDGLMDPAVAGFENFGLRILHLLMRIAPSAGSDWPLSPYAMNDGAVPLQSQLMLDGRETEPVYQTCEVLGWRVPASPPEPNWDLINAHTLASPDHLRVLRGWSHLDTITGRYDRATGHSELFSMVADDLLNLYP